MVIQQLIDLLHNMTVSEKLAQLTQLNPICFGFDVVTPLTGPDGGLRVSSTAACSIGSVLNCDNAKEMIALQDEHLKNDPHHIPLIFMADIVHGFKTIFPIPLAMGCTFHPEAVEEAAIIAARESAVSGIHVTFSPIADLVRDPRWGRVMESFGEDPVLNAQMSAVSVRGYQGKDPAQSEHIAACVKHFAAYGMAEGGREYNTVDLSKGALRDTHFAAYFAAIQAGARLLMPSFNIVDRVPAAANTWLLQDVLRNEWGFTGPVISDFNAIGELLCHSIAADGAEAAQKSLTAGVNIEMMSTYYLEHGEELLQSDRLSAELLDEAVLRVLKLKNDLGLFESIYKDADPERESVIHLCAEHRQTARRIATEAAVLLKNDGVLPLQRGKKIGLAGPFSTSCHVLGNWSAGNEKGTSLYEGLLEKLSTEDICIAASDELGSWLDGTPDIPEPAPTLPIVFKDCDVVIVAVGENQKDTGEGASKSFLRLSPNQEALIRRLKQAKKTIVTVLFSGRPLEIQPILGYSDAVMQAWFLGTESGNALADLLFGDANPSGRLSMSFPYTVGQIPIYYNRFSTGRPQLPDNSGTRYVSRYLDCPVEPLFCFGYGLSYCEFTYRDFAVSIKDGVSVTITVENRSERPGYETIQFYIHDVAASVVRPIKELKGFKKLYFAPFETKTVIFTVTMEMLSFYSNSGFGFEPGEFDLMLGRNSDEVFSQRVFLDEQIVTSELG